MGIDELIFLSNVALAVVTVIAVVAQAREGHRHEEVETKQMADIVHEVMEQEREMAADEEHREDRRNSTA